MQQVLRISACNVVRFPLGTQSPSLQAAFTFLGFRVSTRARSAWKRHQRDFRRCLKGLGTPTDGNGSGIVRVA